MEPSANPYLFTAVQTASPQKIHLMLIEAALRFCGRAREQRTAGQFDFAVESVLRAQEIVTHLMASLEPTSEPARRLSGVYFFVFETLGKACGNRDEALLDDVVRVLEVERETWRLVCEQQAAEAPTRHVPPPMAIGRPALELDQQGFAAEA